jgi:ubiquinone/menaquinone biosynthesis C-methylase UbiE
MIRMSSEHRSKVLQQFTKVAEAFSSAPQFTDVETLELLVAATHPTRQDESLDVACGAGVVATHFAGKVRHATGIDLTPAMLRKARDRQAVAGLSNLTWDLGDVASMSYADDSFSIVTSRYAIHHMPEPLKVLKEMVRVCRPAGRIAISDISLPDDLEDADIFNRIERLNDPSHACALTQSEWTALFLAVGLNPPVVTRYQIEFPLLRMLKASDVSDEHAKSIDRVVREHLAHRQLKFCAKLEQDRCVFVYPIAVMSAAKPYTGC